MIVPFSRGRLLALMLVLAALDQGTKWLVNHFLIPEISRPLIPGVFQLTLTYNTGAAFSLLEQHPALLTIFSLVLFLLLSGYAFLRSRLYRGEPFSLALLLGGALGNLLDRLFAGRVTDFMDVVFIHYPVFNVADMLIFFGALLLIRSRLLPERVAENA
jgi:signal peptidase II